ASPSSELKNGSASLAATSSDSIHLTAAERRQKELDADKKAAEAAAFIIAMVSKPVIASGSQEPSASAPASAIPAPCLNGSPAESPAESLAESLAESPAVPSPTTTQDSDSAPASSSLLPATPPTSPVTAARTLSSGSHKRRSRRQSEILAASPIYETAAGALASDLPKPSPTGGSRPRKTRKAATLGRNQYPRGLENVAELEAAGVDASMSSQSSRQRRGRPHKRRPMVSRSSSADRLDKGRDLIANPPSLAVSLMPRARAKSSAKSPRRRQTLDSVKPLDSIPAASSSAPSAVISKISHAGISSRTDAAIPTAMKLPLLELASETGDVQFSLADDHNTALFAHSFVLASRAPELHKELVRALGRAASSKQKGKIIHRVEWLPWVGHHLLNFIYSDQYAPDVVVSPPHPISSSSSPKPGRAHAAVSVALPIFQSIEVMVWAMRYQLTRLEALCRQHIHDAIDPALACPVLLRAIQLPELKPLLEFALDYCHKEARLLVKRKEDLHALGVDLLQQVMSRFIIPYDPSASPAFLLPIPPSNLVQHFGDIFESLRSANATTPGLVTVVAPISGLSLAFHPSVLATQSPQLAQLLRSAQLSGDVTKVLKLRSFKHPESFLHFLRYCYYWFTDFSVQSACDLACYSATM
ncbi:MAG: hypothetical protein Q8P67_00875, partial [archaeon]|nr:hypothetical protein [archaeon]